MKNTVLIIIGLMILTACSTGTPVDPAPTEPTSECSVASDCFSRPHDSCEGDWSCTEGYCVYACSATVEPVIEPEPEPEVLPEPEPEPEPDMEMKEYEYTQSAYDYVVKEADKKFAVMSPNFKLVDAGEGFAAALAVKNNKVDDTTFRVVGEFDEAYTENNQPIQLDETIKPDEWLTFEENVTLEQGEIHVFKVTLVSPEDVPSGSYEFKIRAQYNDLRWYDYYVEQEVTLKVK